MFKEQIIAEINEMLNKINSVDRLEQARAIIHLVYNQYLIQGKERNNTTDN